MSFSKKIRRFCLQNRLFCVLLFAQLAFLLVHFSMDDQYYLLPFEVLNTYFDEAGEHKGVKTIPREIFEERFLIPKHAGGIPLHYLRAVLEYYKIKREVGNGSL